MSRKDSIRRTLGSSGIKATVPPKPAHAQPHKAAWARTRDAGRPRGLLAERTPPVLLPPKKSEEIVHDGTIYNNYKKNKLSFITRGCIAIIIENNSKNYNFCNLKCWY